VARYLAGYPAADNAVLIASELSANVILHSRSRTEHFAIRAELHSDHVRIEVEDLGGPWRRRQPDGRPHGLKVVEALTGPDGWGFATTTDGCRIVWTRLDLKAPGE
jgi:anti-sigma regulatory factor (Ser/Thr protein kinase)